jgi:hypothetical protein
VEAEGHGMDGNGDHGLGRVIPVRVRPDGTDACTVSLSFFLWSTQEGGDSHLNFIDAS